MALIEFKNLPNTSTPLTAENLNNNFNELDSKIPEVQDAYSTSTTEPYSANYVNEGLEKFGKKLWEGSFTSGSITVPNLTDYTWFIVYVGPVMCFGTQDWGGGIIGGYGSLAPQIFSYRLDRSGNTLSISNESRGGSDGTSQQPITRIYGMF